MIEESKVTELNHPKKILTESDKQSIKKAVQRTIDEYGETLKLLGKE